MILESVKYFPSVLYKSFPISLNYSCDYIPFTLSLIMLRTLNISYQQAILTLGFSYLNFGFGHLVGIQDVIGIRGSQLLGQKNYKLYWQKISNYLIYNWLMVFLACIFVLKSKQILIAVNIDPDLINDLSSFVKKLLFVKLIENINNVLKGILVSQKITKYFFFTNIVNVILFTSIAFVGITGFLIAYYTKMIVEFFMLVYVLINYSVVKGMKFSIDYRNLFADLKYFLFIIIGLYGEYFAVESCAYYTAVSGKIEYVTSWQFYMNTCIYCYFIMLGINSMMRTETGFALGEQNIEKFIKIKNIYLVNGTIAMLILGTLICTFSYQISGIFSQDEIIRSYTTSVLKVILFIAPMDFIFVFHSTLLRIIHKENISFLIGAILFPLMIVFFGYLYFVKFQMSTTGLALGWLTGELFSFLSVIYLYNKYNSQFFERIRKMNKQSLETELLEISLN